MLPVDHIIYATPDLPGTVAELSARLGVEPAEGGRHPNWGTRNYLLSLGSRMYLEVLGPDPEQDAPPEGRLFGLDQLAGPRLLTWAARASDLPAIREGARTAGGHELGEVQEGRRTLPDGNQLAWMLTDPAPFPEGGVVPFLIDWMDSPHPSTTTPAGCRLLSLEATHPEPDAVRALLKSIPVPGLGSLILHTGPSPGIRATLQTPQGEVVLT